MATRKGKFLQGVLGPFVYRVVNGQQQVASKPLPGTMKQTAATKAAFKNFSMASSLGGSIRNSLSDWINGNADWQMVNRLVSNLSATLIICQNAKTKLYSFQEDSFASLEGLEFNIKSKLASLMSDLPESIEDAGILTVTIPELQIEKDLKFPDETFQCKVIVNVSYFRLSDGLMASEPDSQFIAVTRDKKYLKEQSLIFNVPQGCLCIVSTFLEYANYRKDAWLVINNKEFNPGQVVKVLITAGTYQNGDGRIWFKMKQFKQN